jgi:hypothetical protein
MFPVRCGLNKVAPMRSSLCELDFGKTAVLDLQVGTSCDNHAAFSRRRRYEGEGECDCKVAFLFLCQLLVLKIQCCWSTKKLLVGKVTMTKTRGRNSHGRFHGQLMKGDKIDFTKGEVGTGARVSLITIGPSSWFLPSYNLTVSEISNCCAFRV